MAAITPEERFRQLAEMEAGSPVSAAARTAHERANVSAGRGLYLDLSTIPEPLRPAVIAELKEVVMKATTALTPQSASSQPQSN
jgi:hypothetical protein